MAKDSELPADGESPNCDVGEADRAFSDVGEVQRGWDETASLFLPAGYRYRLNPHYCTPTNQEGAEVVAQPEVYAAAEAAAVVLGCRAVIDLGCGSGSMLAAMAGKFDVVGVDYGPNIESCKSAYGFGQWIEADLETTELLPLPPDVVGGSLLICADVIEHLISPLGLVGLIRELLTMASIALISTPDRVRTWGRAHLGPPPNLAHVREWSLEELRSLLESQELNVAHIGYTRAHTNDSQGETILCVCSSPTLPADQVSSVVAACREVVQTGLTRAE